MRRRVDVVESSKLNGYPDEEADGAWTVLCASRFRHVITHSTYGNNMVIYMHSLVNQPPGDTVAQSKRPLPFVPVVARQPLDLGPYPRQSSIGLPLKRSNFGHLPLSMPLCLFGICSCEI